MVENVIFFHHEDNVYVAIKAKSEGWCHIYLPLNTGVLVIHASSGLGSSLYTSGDGKVWKQSNKFAWAMRDPSVSEEANNKRKEFLKENGWVASTWNMGNKNEYEFIINKQLHIANKLAIVHAADAGSPRYWPASLRDASIKREVVWGDNALDVIFDMAQWGELIFKN
jgi:hypothetical protein